MARPTSKLDASDPLVLDRLVDGELTEADERDVIAQLNTIPDGWRRCALAFLEARCWQRAAAHIRELSAVPAPTGATVSAERDPQGTPPGTGNRSSRSARCSWSPSRSARCCPEPGWAALPHWPTAATSGTNSHAGTLVDNAQQGLPTAPGAGQDLIAQPNVPDSSDLLLGNVRLVDNAGQPFDIPVYDWNEDVAEQLMYPAQALPSEFYQQLKRHEVRSHQRFVPVRLQDGRQVVVPVQKVEIVPVGGVAY